MLKNIDHIAIKVTGIDRVRDALETLGIPCKRIEKFDEVGMKIAFLGNNETTLELLETIDQNSPIVNDKPGLHHLGIKVKNIEETYDMMKQNDRYIVQGEIRKGAHSRIFFFRIDGQEDILFECVE